MATTPLTRRRVLRRVSTAIAGTVAALALVACGGNESSSSDANDEPVSGGTLRIATSTDAQPEFVLSFRLPNLSWQKLVFESLVEVDSAGQAAPVLATDWSIDEAAGTITLDLREGVTFHDGRALTSADVIATLELAQDPANGSQLAHVANAITFEAIDTHTVELTFTGPSASVMDLLGMTPIVDAETFASISDGTVNGTGPFTWENWSAGAAIDLARNPEYWDPERPHFDAVEISVLASASALQSALTSGAADIAMGLPLRDASLLDTSRFELVTSFQGVVYPLGLNVTEPPFDDVEVRRAIGSAIDRERIIEQVFVGVGDPTDLWWTPEHDDYPTELSSRYTYDPDAARDMLAESGAAGAEITITYNSDIPEMRSIYEIVQNNLTEVGLTVVDNGLPATEYGPRQAEGNLGQAFLLLHGQIGWSAPTIAGAMPSIMDNNPSHFATAEYVALRDAMVNADEADRPAALEKLSEYMLDEAFSHVIAVAPWKYAVASSVEGIEVSPLGALIATDAYQEQG